MLRAVQVIAACILIGFAAFLAPSSATIVVQSGPRLHLAADEQSDWITRSTGPGVVWAHDFSSDAEVSQFRVQGGLGSGQAPDGSGHDGHTRRITTDGFNGGALEINIPTSGYPASGWYRPFSPIQATDNGLATDDPAADGSLTLRAWNSANSNMTGSWKNGYYADSSYHNHATRGSGGGWQHDGTDFYIQFRTKIPASRYTSGNPDGKLVFISITGNGSSIITPNQELLIESDITARYRMYTNFGNRSNSYLWNPQGSGSGPGAKFQPGGAYDSTCVFGSDNSSTCWHIPPDEWITILIHVVPGTDGGGGDNPVLAGNTNNNTTIEVWIARAGASSYTKIWEKTDYVWSYGQNDPTPYGFNAFIATGHMAAGDDIVDAFYHRYDQIIFSHEFIPCPAP